MVSARGGHWRGRGDGPVCFRAWPHEWPCSHGYTLQRSTCVGEASPGTQNQEDTRIHILLRDRRRETDTQRQTHRETDAETDRHGERQTWRETRAEAEMGSDREGRVAGPGSVWLAALACAGWAGRQEACGGGLLLHLESKTWKQLWAARLETQAQCLITQLVILGPGSVFL